MRERWNHVMGYKKVSNFALSLELNLGDYSKEVCFMRYILVDILKDNLAKCGHLANFENLAKFGYITKSFLDTVPNLNFFNAFVN